MARTSARSDESENPRARPGDNKRKDAIAKAHADMYKLEKQEETLMDLHIKPIREKKNKIKNDLKTKYEIGAKMFNARHGVYYYEREAEDGSDWITLQVIKEQWEATPVGRGLDLVDIAEKAEKQRKDMAVEKAKPKQTDAVLN